MVWNQLKERFMAYKVKVIKVYNNFDEFEREINKYTEWGYRPLEGARIVYSNGGGVNYYITMVKDSNDKKLTLKDNEEEDGL